jgi:hypothetical protein
MNRIQRCSVSATCLIRPPKGQFAGRGLLCGLLVGQAAGGITQEVTCLARDCSRSGTFHRPQVPVHSLASALRRCCPVTLSDLRVLLTVPGA